MLEETRKFGLRLAAVRERAVELEQTPIRHRVAGIAGDPVRAADADRDGWFAWTLPISDGTAVQIRIPGWTWRGCGAARQPCRLVPTRSLAWLPRLGPVRQPVPERLVELSSSVGRRSPDLVRFERIGRRVQRRLPTGPLWTS